MQIISPLARRVHHVLIALIFSLGMIFSQHSPAVDQEGPASWPRWLESSPPVFAFSPHAMAHAPEETSAAVADEFDATQSVLDWTQHTLRLIRKYQQNPLRAARSLAILHAAMHDALVLAARDPQSATATLVAVHRAAGLTLAYLYPNEPVNWIEAKGLTLGQTWAQVQHIKPELIKRALIAGEHAANDAISHALMDGSDKRLSMPRPISTTLGQWRAAPPLNLHTPMEPLAGKWQVWVAGNDDTILPPPPLEYGSARFWAEAEEVYRVWQALTPEQKAIAETWNLDSGSITPAGVWNLRAIDMIRAAKLAPETAIRILATENIAMMDAFIACWKTKFMWRTVRPVTVIQERFDANFLPHVLTPPFPSYVSGHASASGAAATVLSVFFPEQEMELQAYAEEAALSRLYGGIHYRSDNEEGLQLGRRVGTMAAKQALTVIQPPPQGNAGKNP